MKLIDCSSGNKH